MNWDIHELAVQIVRFVDDSFPGWVACEFLDAEGRLHELVDKYPVFSAETLEPHSKYPRPEVPNVRSWAEAGLWRTGFSTHQTAGCRIDEGLVRVRFAVVTIIDWRSLTPVSLNPEKRASSGNS
jgi:hypothetical protein